MGHLIKKKSALSKNLFSNCIVFTIISPSEHFLLSFHQSTMLIFVKILWFNFIFTVFDITHVITHKIAVRINSDYFFLGNLAQTLRSPGQKFCCSSFFGAFTFIGMVLMA